MADADVATGSVLRANAEQTHWDRVAETTTWGRYVAEIEKRTIEHAADLIGEPGLALDVGCGGGRWTKLLADRGWRVTATEVNAQALAICRRNVPTAHTILSRPGDTTLPAESHTLKLVLCVEVIPVIEAPWFLTEAYRVLAPGGLLVGVHMNGRSWRAIAWRMKQRFIHGRHNNQFYSASYTQWRRRLSDTGFNLLHEESFCWGPFSRDSNSPWVATCARMERSLGLHHVVSWSPWIMSIAQKLQLQDGLQTWTGANR